MGGQPQTLGFRWWAAVLSAAALLRALVSFGLLGDMPLVSDARDYFDFGAKLAAGEAGDAAFYWPPGEPALLALAFAMFGKGLFVARLTTIATSVATVALTASMAREVAGDRFAFRSELSPCGLERADRFASRSELSPCGLERADRSARIAGWIAALYPPSVLLCGQTYAQHLASLCLAALAYFGLRCAREPRAASFAAAGAALGFGCLTRPSMASVLPVVAVALWIVARRGGSPPLRYGVGALLGLSAALVLVTPALAHDARAGAGWTLSTNNERNFFLGNNPYTPDWKTSHLGQRPLEELDPQARAYLESFYERPDARAAMRREALAYVAAHPLRSAWRTANRLVSFWGFDYLASREIQRWRGGGAFVLFPLVALEAGGYFAVALLAVVGLFAMTGNYAPAAGAWLVGLALAYEAPYAIAFSGGTYHFPAMPLLVPFAAVALADGRRTIERALASRAALAGVFVFAAIQVEYAWVAFAMRD
jgi:hypothetical protein